jgi:excisionase family DNA binding protein
MKSPDLASKAELNVPASPPALELPAPHAYRIRDVCKLTGLGRTTIYAAIKAGALIARRYGRCTIVLAEDVAAFLHNLPKTR